MKNLYFFEPYTLIMDTLYTNDWASTMMQLMKLSGNNLYEHSICVALLTAKMALSDNQKFLSEYDIPIHSLILGALLHDIGYIGIPCSINRTAIELECSPIEKMAFSLHIAIGSEQIRLHTKDTVILDIVSMHHEYLDGSGTPLGLKCSSIPAHVRIVTLANFLTNSCTAAVHTKAGQVQHFLSVLQSILTNENNYQKYDISILKTSLAESKIFLENLSSLYSDFSLPPSDASDA